MSPSSTSASNPTGWRRLRRLGLIFLAALLLLELIFRLPVVAAPLDPFADLLWYDVYLATYTRDLRAGAEHEVWLLGSSYMMTGLNPQIVAAALDAAGVPRTVQNYGLNRMQNLAVMSAVFDRWLFTLDEPDAVVLAVGRGNFGINPPEAQPVMNSPIESALIFPDGPEDVLGGWLFQHSALVHYGALLRNVVDTRDVDERGYFMDADLPLGGYVDMPDQVYTPENCDLSAYDDPADPEAWLALDWMAGYEERLAVPLDEMAQFITMLQDRGLPLVMVFMPDQACDIAAAYGSYGNYRALLVEPVLARIAAFDVPVLDLTARFYDAVPAAESPLYFANHSHANHDGAELFSAWVGEWLAGQSAARPVQ